MSQAFEYALHISHTADFERNKSKSLVHGGFKRKDSQSGPRTHY